MAGYDELKIQVGFELDKNAESKIKQDLAKLNKDNNFLIDATINLKKDDVGLLERLEKTLDKLNKSDGINVNKISQIGKVFSSLTIDDSIVANINKIQKSLESFSKLSVDLQKRLANVSLFEGTESELKGVTMNMKQFDEQVDRVLSNIQKGIKGSSEQLTGYVNAQTGTVEVLVEKLNDVFKVTKNIDASGNVIGKVTGNVDGYVKNITSIMKSNYDKLLKYEDQYYKAVLSQDRDMVDALDSVMEYYKYQQKQLKQALDNNGLTDYAKDTVREIEQIYAMTSKISDVKNTNLFDDKALDDYVKKYSSVIQQLKKYETELLSATSKGNQNDIDFLNSKLEPLRATKEELEMLIPTLKNWEKALDISEKKDRELQDRIKQKQAQLLDKETAKTKKEIEDLGKSYEKLGDSIEKSLTKASKLKDNFLLEDTNIKEIYEELDRLSKIDFSELGKKDVENLLDRVKELNKALKEIEDVRLTNKNFISNNLKVDKLESEFKSLENQIRETFGNDYTDKMIADLKELRVAAEKSGDEFEIMARKYANTMADTKIALKSTTADQGGFFKDVYENLFTFTAGELLADGIQNVGRALKDIVMEYDAAMTNLKKVANPEDIMSASQLDAIEQKAVSIAKNVGMASQDVISAIADTIQMSGRSMEESIVIAEQTMMLANVAEMTQESASQAVVSMMAAFNLDPLKEVPIVVDGVTKSTTELTNAMDMVNYVGNNFSISSEGIVNALQKGGAVLAQYGVSMTDTIALVTGANKVLQDPEVVGNGLKSIAINLAGVTTSAKDGSIQLNKTGKVLKQIAGIDVFKDKQKTQVKDMAQIMDEINTVWDSLTQKDQLALAEAIAGKQQAKVFQGLMAGWEDVKKVQKELTSGDHFGSALAENAQYVDSISGKLNALKETWVGIFQTIFDDTSIKGLLDGLIAVSEVIADIVTALDKVDLATPFAALSLIGGTGLLKGLAKNGVSGIFTEVVKSMFELSGAADEVEKKVVKTQKSTGLLGKAFELVFGSKSVSGTKATAEGVETVAKASKLSVSGLKEMAKGLWSTIGLTGKITLVGGAILGIGGAIKYASEHLDRQAQKLKENINTQTNEINQLEQKKNSLKSIQEEYDSLNSNQNRTAEESARLLELTKQIAAIMPELVTGYDSAGNPIINMKGDVSDLIAEMERGIDTKKRLLSVEQQELAKNSMKQLNSSWFGSSGGKAEDSGKNKEVNKLLEIETKYNQEIGKLYKERQNLEYDLIRATGDKREELVKKLTQHDNEILKTQEKFNTEYAKKWSEIQEHSKNIGEGIFGVLESGYTFDSYSDELKQSFSGLKDVLDFSDIDSEDKLYSAQNAIRQLGQAASYGKLDLDQLKKSIEHANLEFARSGDIDTYNRSIAGLVDQVHSVTGIDKNILTDLFAGLPRALQGAETSLDSFMKAFGRTSFDLQNQSDKVAQAVKNSYDAIQKAIENSTPTGIEELDYKVAIDLSTDQNLPEELRDLVRGMINSGVDSAEVLTIAQKIMIDMSDGEVDIDSWNTFLENTFGHDRFNISPKILVTPEIEAAQMEASIAKVEQAYGKIPDEIITLFKTNSVTAESDMNRVMAMYELCPEEVITLIETQGSEQAYQTINELMEKYNRVPPEIKTVLKNNGVESISEINRINELYNQLPPEIQTYIKVNNYEALLGAETVQDILDKIPERVLTNLTTEVEGEDNALSMHKLLKEFPEETRTKLTVDDSGTQDKLSWWDKLFGKNKQQQTATVNVNAQVTGQDQVNNLASTIASLTGGGGWAGSPSGGKGARTIDQPVDYAMELDANIPMPLASANGGGLGGRGGGGGHTVVINVAVQGLENITSLKNDLNTINAIEVVVGTATAAKNISGLMVRVREYKTLASSIKAITFSSNTAQSAQNISGLNRRIMEYSQLASSIKPLVFKSETAQSAKNISGLIRKVGEYNSVNPKTLNFRTNASSIAAQINNLAKAARNVPNGKTITYSIKQNGSIPKVSARAIGVSADNIQANTLAIQQSVQDGIGAIDTFNANSNLLVRTPVIDNIEQNTMTRGRLTNSTNIANNYQNTIDSVKYSVELFKELENRIKMVGNSLSSLDKQYENAVGKNKVAYLQKQNELYQEQFKLVDELYYKLYDQRSALWWELEHMGFEFTDDWNISNYEEKMLEMERRAEELKAKSDSANDALNSYSGDDEATKNNLKSIYEAAKKEADDYNDYLNKCKSLTNEYFDIHLNKLPEANDEWYDLNNKIKETADSLEEINRQQRLLGNQNTMKQLNYEYDKLSDSLDIIDIKLKNVYGTEKLNLIKEQINLLKQQQEKQNGIIGQYEEMLKIYRDDLSKYGFTFDNFGDVTNMSEMLNILKDNEDIEKINKVLEEYIDIQRDQLPDAIKEWETLNSVIKDSYKEQLDITKEIEDKITKVYKKQVEDRIDLVKKELDERLKALDKQKQAYNDARSEI